MKNKEIIAIPKNNKNDPIMENTSTLVHKKLECGHSQEILIGVTEVKCQECSEIVDVNIQNEPEDANSKSTFSWGSIGPQITEKKSEIIRTFSSEIVKVGKTLTKHIAGAKNIRAVVYVLNPKEILNFLDQHNVDKMELVMGHQRVHDFRSELTPDIVEKLVKHRNSGRLTLYVSPKVHFHSKIYICEFDNSVKMINGSANLTKTGLGVKGTQWNHIWILDLKGDYTLADDYLNEIEHYETYRSKTTEFFGDFGDAFEQIEPEKKIEVIENWIASGDVYGLPEDAQIRKVTRLIIDEVMSPDLDAEQTVVSIIPTSEPPIHP